MRGNAQARPASLLRQAQQALSAAERDEQEERGKFLALKKQEEAVSWELRWARTEERVRDRREDLFRKKEKLAHQKAHQREALRGAGELVHAARRTYEALQRRVLELQNTVRREERAVAHWQRQIKDAEQHLARWERMLVEAQARLERARLELTQLADSEWP